MLARADEARTGDGRVIENPTSGGDLKMRVNVGGTRKDALTLLGASATAAIGSASSPSTAFHGVAGGLEMRGVLATSLAPGAGSTINSESLYMPYFYNASTPTSPATTARAQYLGNKAGANLHGWGVDLTGNMVFGTWAAGTGALALEYAKFDLATQTFVPTVGVIGKSDASAACAGCVGETITAGVTAGPTASADTAVNGTGSVALTAGRWLLCYDIFLSLNKTADGTNNQFDAEVIMETTANVAVAGTSGTMSSAFGDTLWAHADNVSRCVTISISTTTSYRLQLRASHASSGGTAGNGFAQVFNGDVLGSLGGSDTTSTIYGVRL